MTAPERINTLKLIEKQLPEGTKALDGTALRFCFVSACDGAEYAPMDAVTHDIELLKAQHAQAFSAGYEAGEKDHQAALDRIAELEWTPERCVAPDVRAALRKLENHLSDTPRGITAAELMEAALGRIAELEGAVRELADHIKEHGFPEEGPMRSIARAVLAKGDG